MKTESSRQRAPSPNQDARRRCGPGPWRRSSARASASPDPAHGARWRRCCCGPRCLGPASLALTRLLLALAIGIALAMVLGVPAATIVERESGRTDPGFVVIDEVAGQWIALLGSPADWRHGLIALVLFRLFDITKPFPVRRFERLPGGWGIVFDDVAAGLVCFGYSVVAAHLDLIWFAYVRTIRSRAPAAAPRRRRGSRRGFAPWAKWS